MRQMASDPIKTAHEPKANESHKMSAAINCSPSKLSHAENLTRTRAEIRKVSRSSPCRPRL
jgi:hypothetical protein